MVEDRETKHGGNKNGKKEGLSGSSFFTWFMVIALLGVWTSVAVVWFDLVDYEEVLAKAKDFRYNLSEVLQGKLGVYDADGDGDFDVDDAKVLLGLTKDGSNENIDSLEEVLNILAEESSDWFYGFLSFLYDVMTPFEMLEEEESETADDVDGLKERSDTAQTAHEDSEGPLQAGQQATTTSEQKSIEDEVTEKIQSILNEAIQAQQVKDKPEEEVEEPAREEQIEVDVIREEAFEIPTRVILEDENFEGLEAATFDKGTEERDPVEEPEPVSHDYYDVEETEYEQVNPEYSEPVPLDEILEHEAEDRTYQDYDRQESEHEESTQTEDRAYETLETEEAEEITGIPLEAEALRTVSVEDDVVPLKEHQEEPSDTSQKEAVPEQKEKAKKKKPKLLNKFDRSIKAELDAAEKLRKKGKVEEAVASYEELVRKYPQSPRARYGKAQCEDDLAEKKRSNEILKRAIETYGEVPNLPNVPTDLVKLSLKRLSDRQQFLGHMRRSILTLQRLVQLFPNDTSFKNDLGVGYLLVGDNDSAKKVYEEVLSLTPNDGFAKVHYGFILKAENKIAESIPYLKEGLESGDPGTDDGRFYFHLGDAMQRVGNKEAHKWYELGHKRGHFASVWQRSLYNVNGLKAQPWWTAKETGYTELVKALERNWRLIRDEGLAVMDKTRGLFLPEDENLREKGDWSQFTLWQQGRKNENACKSVPRTCALLDRFPETTGCRRGQIKYSVMHPGTHVWPHTGPTNCRLRMHLGLVVPEQGCRLRCAQDTTTWAEGKVLIFDDSFEHEVWQEATSLRLILIVDVWHPELTPQQRHSLPAI
ncbi:aspartyl/asparaginyl beta-hydroxylase isoform X2 [Ornithorhynchus anatinus]|uniref:Aspartate beta-hydroxylase n=1 Tax=Ornithorhynchus anatinus TaxID=9258 RepID=A0A6I8NJR6_ORNAN|nr:aspartyl/asparaginyl beta-hydroxylase isoform X2 [Ornithorhynchus anatinus]